MSKTGSQEAIRTPYDHIDRGMSTRTRGCRGHEVAVDRQHACHGADNSEMILERVGKFMGMMQYHPRSVCSAAGMHTFRRIPSPCQEGRSQLPSHYYSAHFPGKG